MHDDSLVHKAASIERCVDRAKAEHARDADTFAQDFTRRDAAILNIQRACEAALDRGKHLLRRERLGAPQSARDVFELLHAGGWLSAELAAAMKRMVGFRNIAVHDYPALQLPIMVNIICHHLGDFLAFTEAVLTHGAQPPSAA